MFRNADGTACNAAITFAGNPVGAQQFNACQAHFDIVKQEIADTYGMSDQCARSFAMIHCSIQDRALFKRALLALDALLGAFRTTVKSQALVNHFAAPPLHWLLKRYEERYGFTRDCVMTGILSPEAFLEQLQGHYVALDYGPGPNHGAFTHRLQWFVVMWAASGGTLDGTQTDRWSIRLEDLWDLLGGAETRARILLPGANRHPGEAGAGLWSAMFDLAGNGNFNHPDAVHAAVRRADYGAPQLTQDLIAIQHDVVTRRVEVIERMMTEGKARYGLFAGRDQGDNVTDRTGEALSARGDLIAAAETGCNLAEGMRFKNGNAFVSDGTPKRKLIGQGPSFHEIVESQALKLFKAKLVEHGRWVKAGDNLYVRAQPVRVDEYLNG